MLYYKAVSQSVRHFYVLSILLIYYTSFYNSAFEIFQICHCEAVFYEIPKYIRYSVFYMTTRHIQSPINGRIDGILSLEVSNRYVKIYSRHKALLKRILSILNEAQTNKCKYHNSPVENG